MEDACALIFHELCHEWAKVSAHVGMVSVCFFLMVKITNMWQTRSHWIQSFLHDTFGIIYMLTMLTFWRFQNIRKKTFQLLFYDNFFLLFHLQTSQLQWQRENKREKFCDTVKKMKK